MPDYEEFIFAVGLFVVHGEVVRLRIFTKKFKTGGFQNEKGNY